MKSKAIRNLSLSALFCAVQCVCSVLSVQITVIPVTLATFGVFLTGLCLPVYMAAPAQLAYLLIGGIGLPVFAGFASGFGVLLGPTGGYLWSYPLVAAAVSLFTALSAKSNRKVFRWGLQIVGCLLGLALCYLCGTLQFIGLKAIPFSAGLKTCVLPFIPFDLIKMALAVVIGDRIRRGIRK